MRIVTLVCSVLLSGCVLSFGGEEEQCYPNLTCRDGLVCLTINDSLANSMCVKPNTIRINGRFVGNPVDGGNNK